MDRRAGPAKSGIFNNASRAPSRAQSRFKLGSTFDPLSARSSRTFLGSKSSLASSSRKNLVSESMRSLKNQAQVIDEDGFDVTPVSLIQQDQMVSKKTQLVFLRTDSGATPNASMFQNSVYGANTVNGQSMVQPFSRSMFSNSTIDMAASSLSVSITDQDLKQTPDSKELEVSESFDISREVTAKDLEKEVEIVLSETDTIFMLDIPSICVDLTTPEAETVKKSNEVYEMLLKSHSGNDNYAERYVQTINDAPKFKQVQTDPIKNQDTGVHVSTWDMYNTYESLKCDKVSHQEETLEELNSRAASRLTNNSASMSRAPTSMGGKITMRENTTQIPGETSIAVSMIESTGSTDNPNVVRRRVVEKEKWDPTVPNNHPLLKNEGLKDSFRTIERAVTQNNYHVKQALYRDVEPIEDPDYPAPTGVNITINNPHLDKLWTYCCPLTKKRKVTCMAWNNTNQDIIAVGYGTFKAQEECTGLICCWSLKNPEFPERIFHAPSGITSLSFSHKNPNLLAAGLFSGTIVLYNARNDSHESVIDSRDALHKHSAPVWQVNWIMKEHSLGESISENLTSISIDGHILQWSIRKGFESTQLMSLKRMVTNKQHAKKKPKASIAPGAAHKHASEHSKPHGVGSGEAYISHHAPGMGFDFWPKDPNIYLACTDEGYIHKCSCSYNEQVLETYIGHTGPVYRVSWSPFTTDYFLSCSADWSVKLWIQDQTAPLQSFSAAQKSVNDVCWSPFSSTIFGCVSEGRVEIWNLDYSSLDPIIVHRPLSTASLTTITFAQNSKVVLVGDTGGEVSVYQLRNLHSNPRNQEDALLTAISSMSKRDTI